MINKGDTVRVVRGKKVPIGTTGKVFWSIQEGQWGPRIGFVADSNGMKVTHWTAAKNVEVIGTSVAMAPVKSEATLFDEEIKAEAAKMITIPAEGIRPFVARIEILEGENFRLRGLTDHLERRLTLLESLALDANA